MVGDVYHLEYSSKDLVVGMRGNRGVQLSGLRGQKLGPGESESTSHGH